MNKQKIYFFKDDDEIDMQMIRSFFYDREFGLNLEITLNTIS